PSVIAMHHAYTWIGGSCMSDHHNKSTTDVCELIVRTLEGTINDDDFQTFEKMLAQNENLRRYYVAFVKMWVHLDALVQMDAETAHSFAGSLNNDNHILQDVIKEDLEALEERSQPTAADIEKIRRITEEQLQKYLLETRCPLTKQPLYSRNSSYIREYFSYQAQRLGRPLKVLAACLIIGLVAIFVYNYLAKGPRLKNATNAWVYREGSKLAATKVDRLRDGDIIVTGEGGDAFIRYRGENTTVQLDENTRFAIVTHEGGKQYRLEQGTMNADVAPQPAEQPMTIRSEQGVCRVVGTDFQVSSNPLGSWLAVRHGCVRLTRQWDKEAIEVDGGQYAIAARGMELATRPFNDNMDLSKDFWLVWPHPLGSRSISMQAMGDPQNANIEYYFECVSGDGADSGWQRGPTFVAENLQPNSEYAYRLKVRHTDQNDTCSPWSLAAASRTTEAITIEAETGELSGVLQIVEDSIASGGKYIYSNNTSRAYNYPESQKNKATFGFHIHQAGYYRIRGWCNGPNINKNSFFVAVDNQPKNGWLWDIQPSTEFADDYVNSRDEMDPVEIWLDPGDHTIDFCVREDGFGMDRFEIERMPNQ
ncbi:MAG: FecR domain-containing protein, partial [Sedimentisphaerales bacterium]|nr:FecR domain-containing protein [Sedimentisphaerales bacterium]